MLPQEIVCQVVVFNFFHCQSFIIIFKSFFLTLFFNFLSSSSVAGTNSYIVNPGSVGIFLNPNFSSFFISIKSFLTPGPSVCVGTSTTLVLGPGLKFGQVALPIHIYALVVPLAGSGTP